MSNTFIKLMTHYCIKRANKILLLLLAIIVVLPLQVKAHEEPPKTQKEKKEAEAKRNKILKNKITRIIIWENHIEKGSVTENKQKYAVLNYNADGLNTSILIFKSNDTLEGKTIKTYDFNKNMIFDCDFEGSGNTSEKSVFQYSGTGLIEKIFNIDTNGLVSSYAEYTYKAKERRIVFTCYKSTGQNNYTYNYLYDTDIVNGNCIEIEHRDSIGTLVMRVINTYDKNGVRTEKAIYNAESKLDYKFTFTYTDDKNFSIITKISATGEIMKTDTYSYNNKNNLISVVSKDKSGTITDAISYTYE